MNHEINSESQVTGEIVALRERIRHLERLTTETREFQDQLRHTEQRFRDLFNHSPGAYALYEIIEGNNGSTPLDFRYLEVNEAFEELLGIYAEDILGRMASEILTEQHEEPLLDKLRQVAAVPQPLRFEHYAEGMEKHLDISVFSPRQGQLATILSDVTDSKRTEEALRLRTAYFKQLFESSPLGIVLLDNDDYVVECNRGFEQLFGIPREEARGRNIDTLIVHDDQKTDANILSQKVLSGEIVDTEGVRCRRDGTPIDVRILAHPILLDDRQIGIYGIYSDISRRKRDALTHLPNRSTFMERLEMELERAARDGELTAVLALDLDHLKDVNDTYGLGVGDAVLQAVADRLCTTLRWGASIARLGGDEFGILQLDLADVGNAAGLARRLLSSLEEPFEIGQRRIHVRASIGIALAPAGSTVGPKQLVAQAERALAEAKADGRGSYKFHAAHMEREVQERMHLGQELHGAIDRDELYLEYQPQIALPEMKLVGVEALLRWRHPHGKKVGPDRFIPVAEASGVIVPIGNWVLRSACEQAVKWQRYGKRRLPVAINLSAVQFKDPGFADSVVETLEQTGLAPELLELELTERILVEATQTVTQTLERLQNLGVGLALDDFGKGYSSLDYVRLLPLQKLKIDRSFVRNLEADRSDAAIVSAITVLGSKLGLKVLAEGVERQSQLDLLAEEGCHEIQGFYFSPPVSPDQITVWMESGDGWLQPANLTN